MKNFIGIYDDFVPIQLCVDLIRHFENSPDKVQGVTHIGTGGTETSKQIDTTIKDSTDLYCQFLDESVPLYDDLIKYLGVATQKYRNEYYESDKIAPWSITNDFNIQRYFPNQGYHDIHCESGSTQTNHRVLAWMCYLNTVTDGGQTRFPSYDLDVEARSGRLVIWPAFFTHIHHGIISKTEIKYIATGWYSYQI